MYFIIYHQYLLTFVIRRRSPISSGVTLYTSVQWRIQGKRCGIRSPPLHFFFYVYIFNKILSIIMKLSYVNTVVLNYVLSPRHQLQSGVGVFCIFLISIAKSDPQTRHSSDQTKHLICGHSGYIYEVWGPNYNWRVKIIL